MTNTEKFLALIEGKNTENIRFFRPILMNFAAHSIGKLYSDFAKDYKTLVEANMRCLEEYKMDAVGLISDPYRETSAFGATITYPPDNVPVCEKPILSNLQDVQQLKIPDVYTNERTFDRIKGAQEFNRLLGDKTPIIGWIEGPLAEACDLTGVSEMLIMLMTDYDFTNALLDKTTEMACNFAKAQIDSGCQIIGIGDAICSQISAEQFKEFELHRLKRIIDFIHENNAYVKLHICGNITHLLPYIKEISPDIVDIDSMVDMEKAYTILGPDIVRCGNIDPVFIEQKSPEDIYNATQELCKKENGRKFILSGGCEITVITPPKNLKAMREAMDSE